MATVLTLGEEDVEVNDVGRGPVHRAGDFMRIIFVVFRKSFLVFSMGMLMPSWSDGGIANFRRQIATEL